MKHITEKDLAGIIRNKFQWERFGKNKWFSLDQAYTYYCEILNQDLYLGEYKPIGRNSFATLLCEMEKEYDWLMKESRRVKTKRKGKDRWVWYVYYAVVNPADTSNDTDTLYQKAAKLFSFNRREIHIIN